MEIEITSENSPMVFPAILAIGCVRILKNLSNEVSTKEESGKSRKTAECLDIPAMSSNL